MWTLQRAAASTRHPTSSSCETMRTRAARPHFWYHLAAVTCVGVWACKSISARLSGTDRWRQPLRRAASVPSELAGQWSCSSLSRLPSCRGPLFTPFKMQSLNSLTVLMRCSGRKCLSAPFPSGTGRSFKRWGSAVQMRCFRRLNMGCRPIFWIGSNLGSLSGGTRAYVEWRLWRLQGISLLPNKPL